MDLDALIRSRVRVKEWQLSLKYRAIRARYATEESIKPLYIRSFAWTGSVEPCTGVLCETCQRCLRDFVILKVSEGTHHPTASSMLAAVEIGCRVCTCLWRQYFGDQSIDPENVPKEMNEGLRNFSAFWSFSRQRSFSRSRRLPRLPIFTVWNTAFPEWYLGPLAIRNEMLPRIDQPSYQNDRITLMSHYWKLAMGWLSECLSHHTRCRHIISVEKYCPTRLIEVRTNSSHCELRLYSTSNGPIKEPYMTLSHCWGTSQPLRLTTSTLDRLQKGFALAELPPTFQDAIMVTRALGIKFLWIDALCIIQDSIVDWQHEATLMSQVYSNSICNVSALDAHDSTGGLFLDRQTSNVPYCTFKTCRKFKRKRVCEFAYTDFWSDSVQHAPLTRRAWVFQERLLAPRVLHFGKRQLLWECNELRACEVYPRGMRATDDYATYGSNTDKFLKESLTTILQGASDNTLTSSQMFETWFELVHYYSKCNLTISGDKLVAISGIVKRLQPSFKTDYLAGLWRDYLLEQMLWHVDYDIEADRSLVGKERQEYRAPSWSWASIDAPVVIEKHLIDDRNRMADVTEACVIPLTDDITGQIKGGYIRLRAHLFPIRVEISTKGNLTLSWDWGEVGGYIGKADVWSQSAIEGLLQFVPLVFNLIRDREALHIHGLILQPVEGNQGVYQRWGHVAIVGNLRGGRNRKRDCLNFGFQQINGEWTYNPPEKYPEQIITLI